MPTTAERPRNRLLSLMEEHDYALLQPHLEFVALKRGTILGEPNETVRDIYFPQTCVISMVMRSPEGLEVEAGLVGREGFTPGAPVMGVDFATERLQVQLAGNAFKIAKQHLLAVVEASPPLRVLLTRFIHTMLVQTASTALTNAVHQIDARLARWLLMVDDRCDGGEFMLTHEFMSLMLAVRRPSVTTSLLVLEGNRLIRTGRGMITVRDRAAMERFAGDSYGTAEDCYRRLIGDMRPPEA